jgi:hypothetical protein
VNRGCGNGFSPTIHLKPRREASLQVPTRNFYAPLRNTMEVEERQITTWSDEDQQATIIITSATNLLQLQKKFRGLDKGIFEFRDTTNGTRVVTKDMADFSAIKFFLQKENLYFLTFHPKSLKPIKAVI